MARILLSVVLFVYMSVYNSLLILVPDTSIAEEPELVALDRSATESFLTVSDLFAAVDRGISGSVKGGDNSTVEGGGISSIEEGISGSVEGSGSDLVEESSLELTEGGSMGLAEGGGSGAAEVAFSPEPTVQDPVINDIFFDENEFYQCGQCTKTFHSEIGLTSHVKTHHETTTEIQLQCPFCIESYSDSQSVDQHILLSHPESSGINC